MTTGPPLFGEFLLILGLAAGVGIIVSLAPPSPVLISKRIRTALFAALVVLGAVFLGSLAILRHESFHSHAFDLGVMVHWIWNTAQGRWFESTMNPTSTNLLGNHWAPILLLLALPYRLFPEVNLLLAFQAAGLALGALPLYWVARQRLGEAPAFLLGLSYLLYAPLLLLNLADFHEIALSTPLLALALAFLLQGSRGPMLAALALALLTREEIGLIVAAFGFLLLLQRSWRLGGLLIIGGLLWTGLAVALLVPFFQGEGRNIYLERYRYLGDTPLEMAATLLFEPLRVLGHLATWERAEFLLRLLVPLGLLPLLAPDFLLLSLPTLGYLLLSDYPPQFDITSQYHAPLIPLFFFGAVVAIQRLQGRGGVHGFARGVAAAVLTATLLSYFLHGPGPLARDFDPTQYALTERTTLGHRLLEQIPPEGGVAAQDNLAPHLANREILYLYPWVRDWKKVDYIALDRQGNTYPFPEDEEYERAVAELLANPAWAVIAEQEGFLILKRSDGS